MRRVNSFANMAVPGGGWANLIEGNKVGAEGINDPSALKSTSLNLSEMGSEIGTITEEISSPRGTGVRRGSIGSPVAFDKGAAITGSLSPDDENAKFESRKKSLDEKRMKRRSIHEGTTGMVLTLIGAASLGGLVAVLALKFSSLGKKL